MKLCTFDQARERGAPAWCSTPPSSTFRSRHPICRARWWRCSPRARPLSSAGYLVADDVSVRDWQLRTPTMTMGKSFDTHGPLGPWLATSDEAGDPHGLRLRTWVNGGLRQDSNTKQLIFDCFALVEHLSTAFT